MKEAEQMGLKRREVGGERGHKEKLETRRPTDRPTRFCFSPCFRTAHFVTSEEEEVKWCGAARRGGSLANYQHRKKKKKKKWQTSHFLRFRCCTRTFVAARRRGGLHRLLPSQGRFYDERESFSSHRSRLLLASRSTPLNS